MSAPIIILGMHRSGTSMVTRLLQKMGVWVGEERENNCESLFFLSLNDQILRACGGNWDVPEPALPLLQRTEVQQRIKQGLQTALNSKDRLLYHPQLSHPEPEISIPWGWKDPRNSLTLPLWLQLFPNARILHIKRHGMDVAYSLQQRLQGLLNGLGNPAPKDDAVGPHPAWRIGPFWHTARCLNLTEGIKLWRCYLDAAETHIQHHPDQSLSLCYESLLHEPQAGLQKMAAFLNLNLSHKAAQTLTRDIHAEAAFRFRHIPQLHALSGQHSSLLSTLDYGPDGFA